jgi:hypothetical protein
MQPTHQIPGAHIPEAETERAICILLLLKKHTHTHKGETCDLYFVIWFGKIICLTYEQAIKQHLFLNIYILVIGKRIKS